MKNVKFYNGFNSKEYKSYRTWDSYKTNLQNGEIYGQIEYKRWACRYDACVGFYGDKHVIGIFKTLAAAKAFVCETMQKMNAEKEMA